VLFPLHNIEKWKRESVARNVGNRRGREACAATAPGMSSKTTSALNVREE